jgi:hypothetical protein
MEWNNMTLSELIKSKTSLNTEGFWSLYLSEHYRSLTAFYSAVKKRTVRLDTVILILNVLEVKFEDVEWTLTPKKTMIKISARMRVSTQTYHLQAGRPISKNEIRAKAKALPFYHLPIDNGGVDGYTDTGEVIKINCLGKWVFGTAGYKGHIIVMEGSELGDIYLPNDCPQAVYEMIRLAIQ